MQLAQAPGLTLPLTLPAFSSFPLHLVVVLSTKQKELLDAATCQCEEMERKVHQQEVQVRGHTGRGLGAGETLGMGLGTWQMQGTQG